MNWKNWKEEFERLKTSQTAEDRLIRFQVLSIESMRAPEPEARIFQEHSLTSPPSLTFQISQPWDIHAIPIPRLSSKALQRLASDLAQGSLYTSNHIRKETGSFDAYQSKIYAVFPVLFSLQVLDPIGLIYEYKSKATGQLEDGSPTFGSVCLLHREDLPELSLVCANDEETDRAQKNGS